MPPRSVEPLLLQKFVSSDWLLHSAECHLVAPGLCHALVFPWPKVGETRREAGGAECLCMFMYVDAYVIIPVPLKERAYECACILMGNSFETLKQFSH